MENKATIDGLVSVFWISGRVRSPIPMQFAEQAPSWDVLEPLRLMRIQVKGLAIGWGDSEMEFVGGRIVGDALMVSVSRCDSKDEITQANSVPTMSADFIKSLQEQQVLDGIVQPLLDLSDATQTLIFIEDDHQATRLMELIMRVKPTSVDSVLQRIPHGDRGDVITRFAQSRFQYLIVVREGE